MRRELARRATRLDARAAEASRVRRASRSRRRARSRATRPSSSSASSTRSATGASSSCAPSARACIAPWAIAVAARLREKYVEADLHYTDDGMAFRIPACDEPPASELVPPLRRRDRGAWWPGRSTARRSSRPASASAPPARSCFRAATRGQRTPLWAQRKRAGDLLAVASRHPEFPIVLETYRECLRDAFDLPGLVDILLRDVAARRIRVTTVDTRSAVSFRGERPLRIRRELHLRRRRAAGRAPRPGADDRLRAPARAARRGRAAAAPRPRGHRGARAVRCSDSRAPPTHVDGVHDLLLARRRSLARRAPRALLALRSVLRSGRASSSRSRRIVSVRIAGEERFAAAEDVAKLRDALGVVAPRGPARRLARGRRRLRMRDSRLSLRAHPRALRRVTPSRRGFGVDVAAVDATIAALVARGPLGRGRVPARRIARPSSATARCSTPCAASRWLGCGAPSSRSTRAPSPRFLPEWHGIPAKAPRARRAARRRRRARGLPARRVGA